MVCKMQNKKMAGSDAEVAKLESDADELISKFEVDYKAEVENRINKMKEEAGAKIEAEKANEESSKEDYLSSANLENDMLILQLNLKKNEYKR